MGHGLEQLLTKSIKKPSWEMLVTGATNEHRPNRLGRQVFLVGNFMRQSFCLPDIRQLLSPTFPSCMREKTVISNVLTGCYMKRGRPVGDIFVYGNLEERLLWYQSSKMQSLALQEHCKSTASGRMVSGEQMDRPVCTGKKGSNTCLSPMTTSEGHGHVKIAAVAGEDIPPGILSPSISATNPMDVNTVFWNDCDIDYFVEVSLDGGKMLTSLNHDWMKHVRLARHCHMQNIQIILTSNGGLCLQSTNTIKKGEPLFAWFAMDTAKSFEIPFLTLNNIQGGHHYSCHNCGKVFEDPNPLKIHIALLCQALSSRSSLDTSKDISTVPSIHHDPFRTPVPFGPIRPATSAEHFPLVFGNHSAFRPLQRTPKEPSNFQQSAPKFALNGTISALPNIPINYAALSGLNLATFQNFRQPLVQGPCLSYFQMSPSVDRNANFTSGPNVLGYHSVPTSAFTYVHNALGTMPISGHPDAAPCPSNSSPNSSIVHPEGESENQVNMGGIISEQFTTSDGKSKRRHKCFYCSKMYSRKYGLKIHIRTHLNYKPLSCKVCQRRFADPSNLNKHIRLHAEGVTPYRCDLCGKVLVRRRDLERHLKSRHPQTNTAAAKTSKIKIENSSDDKDK